MSDIDLATARADLDRISAWLASAKPGELSFDDAQGAASDLNAICTLLDEVAICDLRQPADVRDMLERLNRAELVAILHCVADEISNRPILHRQPRGGSDVRP